MRPCCRDVIGARNRALVLKHVFILESLDVTMHVCHSVSVFSSKATFMTERWSWEQAKRVWCSLLFSLAASPHLLAVLK